MLEKIMALSRAGALTLARYRKLKGFHIHYPLKKSI